MPYNNGGFDVFEEGGAEVRNAKTNVDTTISFARPIVPRPVDSTNKLGVQTEHQAKLSRAEGQAPESGFMAQAWAFLRSPAGLIVGGFVGLVLLRRFWK